MMHGIGSSGWNVLQGRGSGECASEGGGVVCVGPQDLRKCIKVAYTTRLPLFIWGPPGIGKSRIVEQTCMEISAEMGLTFSRDPKHFTEGDGLFVLVDLRLSQLDPTDLRGLPKIEDGATRWAPPSFLPRGGHGILFLDELNLAPPTIQGSAYQLILDRRLGEYVLPDGWVCIAAGNRASDRANVFDIPSPLANRFLHVELRNSVEEWTSWAVENEIHPSIIAFLNFRRDLLMQFNPERGERAFPTPRSWEYASKILKGGGDVKLVAMAVGEGAARELEAFIKLREKIPDPKEYLINPEKELPEEPSLLYALITSLAEEVKQKPSQRKVDSFCRVAERMSEMGYPEVGVVGVKLLRKLSDMILRSPSWVSLSEKWGEMI